MNREGIGGRPSLNPDQVQRVLLAMRDLKRRRFADNASDLARALGLTPSAVSQALSGKTTPSYPTASAVAGLLGISVEALLSGVGDVRLPNRATAADIAVRGGVSTKAVEEVLAEDHPQDRPILWWIDRMRARAILLLANESGEVGSTAVPEAAAPSTKRVPKAG